MTGPSGPTPTGREVRIDVTPRAARQVRALLDLPDRPGRYGLRVQLDAGRHEPHEYRLSLAPAPLPDELVLPRHGFDLFVRAGDAARLDGLRIDFVESDAAEGFTLDRLPRLRRGLGEPHLGRGPAPSLPSCAPSGSTAPDPDREVERRVQAALATVRPALTADGGDVELVGVQDGAAHVRLVGACSGCSVALSTLTDLIERAVVAAVAEVDRVVLAGPA
jgi:iron-sulfur cluster assembly protein